MCGIAGILEQKAVGELGVIVRKMTDRLIHRGPDGGDIWTDDDAGIALGHRRLAIIDLSQAGHQPMASSCGRMVLSYNRIRALGPPGPAPDPGARPVRHQAAVLEP
jgi:asparagine synthase (glutamine-hydrolysing)